MRLTAIAIMLCLLSLGCATRKFVDSEIEASEARTQEQLEDVKRQVEETQTEIRNLSEELGVKIEGLEDENEDLNRLVNNNTELIANFGQLRFQKTLSEAEANFQSGSAELTEPARDQLDRFAELLIKQNKLVHLEIQGHTDSMGSLEYNLKLGEQRAQSVRNYLYKQHDIPLHLMNVISYGPGKPIADNETRDGRAKNRRVVLVVRVQV